MAEVILVARKLESIPNHGDGMWAWWRAVKPHPKHDEDVQLLRMDHLHWHLLTGYVRYLER